MIPLKYELIIMLFHQYELGKSPQSKILINNKF